MASEERQRKTNMVVAVICFVGLLVIVFALAIFRYLKTEGGINTTWKTDSIKVRMSLIEDGLNRFYLDCGRFPSQDEGLEALFESPVNLQGKWNGRYLKPYPLVDPWGNPFIYVAEGRYRSGGFDLISLGADGQPGGEGENADIVNGNRLPREPFGPQFPVESVSFDDDRD